MLCWCRMTDLNRRPTDYKSVALPTELIRLINKSLTMIYLLCLNNKYKVKL